MRNLVAVLFVLCPALAWGDDSLVSIGDRRYLKAAPGGRIRQIRYPTLGCPSIVKAGTSGTVWARLEGTATTFVLTLTPTRGAQASYPLTVTGSSFDAANGITKVHYAVPSTVPEDMYDLHLGVPAFSISDVQYNSFKVVKEIKPDFPFLVSSDTHFGEIALEFPPANNNPVGYDHNSVAVQMKKEIRALNPAFVVLTGDLGFGYDYPREYEGIWSLWKDTGVPVFMVPGNHDAYASIKTRWFLGFRSPARDGLDHWRRTLGPCNYSFRHGGVHFQGVNSADGTPERRDGFLFIVENYGGDLLPEQMNWISADLASAQGQVVAFMHHNPMGPYRPNEKFRLWWWILRWIWELLRTGKFANWPGQQWNSASTGQFLLAKYASAPIVFVGHSHEDRIMKYGNTVYKHVAAGGSDSRPYWGYAYVEVKNSQIASYLYLDEQRQSLPTGNLHVTVNDDVESYQRAIVESGLARSFEIRIPFVLPTSNSYEVTNGTIAQIAPIGGGRTKVWVTVPSPVAASHDLPERVEVTVKTQEAAALIASQAAPSQNGGNSGSCGLIGLEALLFLGAIALRRLRPRS